MKIMKKRIIIPAFALLLGASLAGSITGTVAWYQYSTRVNAAYVGASTGKSGNLQIRLDSGDPENPNDWGTRIPWTTPSASIRPITSGGMGKGDNLPTKMYRNPIIGHGPYAEWEQAVASDYVVLPLELRYVDRSSGAEEAVANKNIYMSDLTIQADAWNTAGTNDKEDISSAIRVHINNGTSKFLISKNGGIIDTAGKLDLSADGSPDQAYNSADKRYGFDGGTLVDITYGEGTQESYKASDLLVTASENDLSLSNTTDKAIGVTNSEGLLKLTVTIWVEGWQKFGEGTSASAIWDAKTIDSRFDVGFEFAVDPAEE